MISGPFTFESFLNIAYKHFAKSIQTPVLHKIDKKTQPQHNQTTPLPPAPVKSPRTALDYTLEKRVLLANPAAATTWQSRARRFFFPPVHDGRFAR